MLLKNYLEIDRIALHLKKNCKVEKLLEHDDFVELNLAEVDHFEAVENLSAGRVRLHEEGVALKAGSQRRRPA